MGCAFPQPSRPPLTQPATQHPIVAKPPSTLVQRYEDIARLTRPVCLERCPEPGGCCRPRYCELAWERARLFGLEPAAVSRGPLPFLGPPGCTLAPHLRPLCAVHVCEGQLLADPALARAYFPLRQAVLEAEARWGAAWPEGLARDYRE